jgi:competence protein ComGC
MIGNAINQARNIPLENAGADAMTTQYIPAPEIFLVAAIVTLLLFAVIPLLSKSAKKAKAQGQVSVETQNVTEQTTD